MTKQEYKAIIQAISFNISATGQFTDTLNMLREVERRLGMPDDYEVLNGTTDVDRVQLTMATTAMEWYICTGRLSGAHQTFLERAQKITITVLLAEMAANGGNTMQSQADHMVSILRKRVK